MIDKDLICNQLDLILNEMDRIPEEIEPTTLSDSFFEASKFYIDEYADEIIEQLVEKTGISEDELREYISSPDFTTNPMFKDERIAGLFQYLYFSPQMRMTYVRDYSYNEPPKNGPFRAQIRVAPDWPEAVIEKIAELSDDPDYPDYNLEKIAIKEVVTLKKRKYGDTYIVQEDIDYVPTIIYTSLYEECLKEVRKAFLDNYAKAKTADERDALDNLCEKQAMILLKERLYREFGIGSPAIVGQKNNRSIITSLDDSKDNKKIVKSWAHYVEDYEKNNGIKLPEVSDKGYSNWFVSGVEVYDNRPLNETISMHRHNALNENLENDNRIEDDSHIVTTENNSSYDKQNMYSELFNSQPKKLDVMVVHDAAFTGGGVARIYSDNLTEKEKYMFKDLGIMDNFYKHLCFDYEIDYDKLNLKNGVVILTGLEDTRYVARVVPNKGKGVCGRNNPTLEVIRFTNDEELREAYDFFCNNEDMSKYINYNDIRNSKFQIIIDNNQKHYEMEDYAVFNAKNGEFTTTDGSFYKDLQPFANLNPNSERAFIFKKKLLSAVNQMNKKDEPETSNEDDLEKIEQECARKTLKILSVLDRTSNDIKNNLVKNAIMAATAVCCTALTPMALTMLPLPVTILGLMGAGGVFVDSVEELRKLFAKHKTNNNLIKYVIDKLKSMDVNSLISVEQEIEGRSI